MSGKVGGREHHTLWLPVNTLICGKPHVSIYEVVFCVTINKNGSGSVEVTSLVEYTEGQTDPIDLMYIIEDGCQKGVDSTIVTCILYNQDQWDKDYRWWEGDSS